VLELFTFFLQRPGTCATFREGWDGMGLGKFEFGFGFFVTFNFHLAVLTYGCWYKHHRCAEMGRFRSKIPSLFLV
jgi:hypothetical protein